MTFLDVLFISSMLAVAQPGISTEPVDSQSPGILENTEIFGRAKLEVANQTSSGDLQKNEQNIDVEAKSYLSEAASLKAIVRGIHETKLEDEHFTDIDLREFYLDISFERGKFRLGRQQVVWGKTDGLKLLDLINPQDFREFILDDFIDSRIPLWMVRSDFYIGDDTLQLLIIPDVRSHEIPGAGDRFEPAYLKSLRSSGLPMVNKEEPEDDLSNAEVGLRYSGFAGGWDYTLNYLYSWEDNPLFFNEAGTIVKKYKRATMAGGSFSKAFGSFVLRGEAAYNFDKYFTTTGSADGQVEKDELRAALALDYTIGDWLISGQIFESYITDYDSSIMTDRRTTMATFLVAVNLLNDTVELKLLDIYGTDNSDNLARFSATYDMTDNWHVKGGIALFSGPEDSFLGQFGDADRIEAEIIYNF